MNGYGEISFEAMEQRMIDPKIETNEITLTLTHYSTQEVVSPENMRLWPEIQRAAEAKLEHYLREEQAVPQTGSKVQVTWTCRAQVEGWPYSQAEEQVSFEEFTELAQRASPYDALVKIYSIKKDLIDTMLSEQVKDGGPE